MELVYNHNGTLHTELSVFFCRQVVFYPFGISGLFTCNILSKIPTIISFGDKHHDFNIFQISFFGIFVIDFSHLPMTMLKFHRVPVTVFHYSTEN